VNPYRRDDYPVDILIRGYENVALTAACLSSIRRETDPALYQITYVDNGSAVPNFTQLVKNHPDVQFVRLPFNHGSVRAINVGLAMAFLSPSEFVLLMDNDTSIPSGDSEWLNRLMSYFDDETVGAAGAVSGYVSGLQQAEAAPDTYTRDWQENGRGGLKAQPDAPVLVSFAMMIRKSAIQQVGLFDERFEPGMGEDYDIILRLRQAGWRCIVANSVWVKHTGSQTFGKMGFNKILQESYAKLVDKYTVDGLRELGIEVREAA
jgi:GT2 family glycosyltransferase